MDLAQEQATIKEKLCQALVKKKKKKDTFKNNMKQMCMYPASPIIAWP